MGSEGLETGQAAVELSTHVTEELCQLRIMPTASVNLQLNTHHAMQLCEPTTSYSCAADSKDRCTANRTFLTVHMCSCQCLAHKMQVQLELQLLGATNQTMPQNKASWRPQQSTKLEARGFCMARKGQILCSSLLSALTKPDRAVYTLTAWPAVG